MKKILTTLLLLIAFSSSAQTLVWKGKVDNDFFNEANWQDNSTLLAPTVGTIDPGVAITLPVSITNVTKKIIANGTINLSGVGVRLTIQNAWLSGVDITGSATSYVDVNLEGYLDLSSATPIGTISFISVNNNTAWVRLFNVRAQEVNLTKFRVNSNDFTLNDWGRIYKYYNNGAVLRPTYGDYPSTPLTVFYEADLKGSTDSFIPFTVHSLNSSPSNNTIESFILKKGYMVTFATELDGTGKSKVYIASEEDLVINVLPTMLNNTVSYIRVLPWNWITKKGIAHTTSQYTTLNATWRYDWNDNSSTSASLEWVPMSWGSSGTLPASITQRVNASLTHQMGFNEPDNVGQSGGYGNFTDYNVTVPLYKELMKIGCRLVSPGCEENGVFTYLEPFNNLAKASNVRIDAIAIHWSDWGSYSAAETGVTGQKIFDRFKIHLKKVYDMHGLPIWITEFNANPNRNATIQAEFMALALPYLESCEYVERYSWFQSPTNANLYTDQIEANGITPLGVIYRDQVSTPSIPESVVNQRNNLNLKN